MVAWVVSSSLKPPHYYQTEFSVNDLKLNVNLLFEEVQGTRCKLIEVFDFDLT